MSAIARPSHHRHQASLPRTAGRRRVVHRDITIGERAEPRWSALMIRMALASDERGLRRLAQLDSALPLKGQALIAEQGGAIVAALALEDGATIADPFVASADTVALLRLRAAQLSAAGA